MSCICPRCGYSTDNSYLYKKHLKRQNICDPIVADVSLDDEIDKYLPKSYNFPCDICSKLFSTKTGLANHKKTCKTKDVIISENVSDIVKQLVKEELSECMSNLTLQQNDIPCPSRKESFYQSLLTKYFQGKREKLAAGTTDISGNDYHIEIKSWSDWKSSIGQIIAYYHTSPKDNLYVIFFGTVDSNTKKTIIDVFVNLKYDIIILEVVDYIKKIDLLNLKNQTTFATIPISV